MGKSQLLSDQDSVNHRCMTILQAGPTNSGKVFPLLSEKLAHNCTRRHQWRNQSGLNHETTLPHAINASLSGRTFSIFTIVEASVFALAFGSPEPLFTSLLSHCQTSAPQLPPPILFQSLWVSLASRAKGLHLKSKLLAVRLLILILWAQWLNTVACYFLVQRCGYSVCLSARPLQAWRHLFESRIRAGLY